MQAQGSFEIPSSGMRVGGELTIDSDRSELRVQGSLVETVSYRVADAGMEVPMVWGHLDGIGPVTVVDLVSLGGSITEPGHWRSERWICGYAIKGLIEPEQDIITFTEVGAQMTFLSSWLGSPSFGEEVTRDKVTITAEPTDLYEVTLATVKYVFRTRYQSERHLDGLRFTSPSRVVATVPEPLDLRPHVNQTLTPIEALLWTAAGRFSDIRLTGQVGGDPPMHQPVWISLSQPRDFVEPPDRLLRHNLLFTADELPGGFIDGVRRWVDIWPTVRPAIGPLLARSRAYRSYTDDRFLSAVAAMESYSTRSHGEWRDLSDEEMTRRRDVVEGALQEQDSDLKAWVIEALDDANRDTLRNRLRHLFDASGDVARAFVPSNTKRDRLINRIIESRNQVAHSLVREGGVGGGGNLHWTSQALIWILRYHLLIDLGFGSDDASRRVTACRGFEQEAERLRRDLGI